MMVKRSGQASARRLALTGLLCVVLSLVSGLPAHAATAWTIVPSPNASVVPLSNNMLTGVSTLAADDAWAVGAWTTTAITTGHSLIEHWNGGAWSVAPSPSVPGVTTALTAVSAHTRDDVWAVGTVTSGAAAIAQTLIEHWNGQQWSIVPSPNPSTQGCYFTGVAAIAADDVWAAGWFLTQNQGALLPLLEHWNGQTWQVVAPPVASGSIIVNSIAAVSSTDIWIVGMDETSGNSRTFIAHWDGQRWSRVPSPSLGSGPTELFSVVALSGTDAWAVGEFTAVAPPGFAPPRALVEHWDGQRWGTVLTPLAFGGESHLYGLTALSPSDLWAVGSRVVASSGTLHTLTTHWNGSTWSTAPSPQRGFKGNENNVLFAAAAVSPSTIWAVGTWISLEQGNPGNRTLILQTTQG